MTVAILEDIKKRLMLGEDSHLEVDEEGYKVYQMYIYEMHVEDKGGVYYFADVKTFYEKDKGDVRDIHISNWRKLYKTKENVVKDLIKGLNKLIKLYKKS